MESEVAPDETQPSLSPVERLLELKSPQQVVGDIISAGGKVKSYLPGNGDVEWAPKVYDANGRIMLIFSGIGHVMGPRLLLETMRPFIETPFKTDSSKSHGSPQVNMLPLVQFGRDGDFAPEESLVFLFSEEQCNDLRQLLDENK